MIFGFRIALSIWLLYNMWQGRPWALYGMITLLALGQELANAIIGKLVRRSDAIGTVLSELLKTLGSST